MYLQKHFEEQRVDVLHELIRAQPLATFVTVQHSDIVVNHMPFILSPSGENGMLVGHMPRSNPVWKNFDGKTNAVAVFQGPASYISPNWYPSKKEHGRAVPTWNYVVVHAHGYPRVIHDSAWLFSHLNQLTDQQEASQATPWKVSDAPREYAEHLVKQIVGVEIPISSLAGKWKVSQNRSAADRAGVVSGLRSLGDDNSIAMASLIPNEDK